MEWIKYGSATMLFMVTEPYFYVYEIFVFVILSRKIKKAAKRKRLFRLQFIHQNDTVFGNSERVRIVVHWWAIRDSNPGPAD